MHGPAGKRAICHENPRPFVKGSSQMNTFGRWVFYVAVVWLVCQTFPGSLAAVVLVAGCWLATQRTLGS